MTLLLSRNKGLHETANRGIFLLNCSCLFPKKLSDKQKKLLKEFRDTTESVSIVKDSANWLDSLKSYASKVTDYVEEKISK